MARGPAPSQQRPPAPEIHFSKRNDSPAEDRVTCPLCGSRNQRGLRFCVTCGHLLAQPEPLKATLDSNPPAAAGAARRSAPPMAPIAPNRVVPVGESPPAVAEPRICPRCRGASEGQFCRFCGASLGDGQGASLQQRVTSRPWDDSTRSTPAAHPTVPPAALHSPGPLPIMAATLPSEPPPSPAFQAQPAATTRVAAPVATAAAGGALRPRLVLIARDGGEGPSYAVGETTDIGRAEGSIVIGDDRYVSPRHARLALRGGAYYLRDLASTNGVFLRVPFSAGDVSDSGRAREATQEQTLGDSESCSSSDNRC